MGKPADYVPACLPEKKKAPQLVWAILFGLSDNSIYGHHNARIKKMAPLCLSLTFFVAVRVWFATTEKKIVQKEHTLMCLGQNTEMLKPHSTSELFICLYLHTSSSYIGTYRLQMITWREF
jgi:hypothetical protein